MPLSLAKEHRDFFQKHSRIEFSALLSKEQTGELDIALQEKQGGRDLWRQHPFIKKIALKRDFAQVAAHLAGVHEIRIGYDQALLSPNLPPYLPPNLPKGMTSLQQMSCIKPLVMGLILRLTEGPMPAPSQFPCPCPEIPGNGVFFSAQMLLSWEPLLALSKDRFFLIAYAGAHPLYILEKRDPSTHALKNLGYVFGDSLRSDTHPILYSS